MTTIVPCICGDCGCCAHQQQAELACRSFELSSSSLSIKRVTSAVSAMSSSATAAEASATSAAAPRLPLLVDWQIQHVTHGSLLVVGYVYECTGPKVLSSAVVSNGVLVTTDGKQYNLLHPGYDLRTGTIAATASPGFAIVDVATPPVSKSLGRSRRNVPASSPHLRSSSDNRKMAVAVDGCTAHSCSRCMHAGPCSFAPLATAGCAAAAATASGGVPATCSSGICNGCGVHGDKHIERHRATVTCPSQPCLSSTPSTVHCRSVQPLPPVVGPSAAAAVCELLSPLLRPPTPFGDVGHSDVHVPAEADPRPRDACGATARLQQNLADLTTTAAMCPSSSLPTVGTSNGQASSGRHCPNGSRRRAARYDEIRMVADAATLVGRARRDETGMAAAASLVGTMPVAENIAQTACLRNGQPLSCKVRTAQHGGDHVTSWAPVALTSAASAQTLNRSAVAANCNRCTAALSLLANSGLKPAASRRIAEPIQDETLAESSQQSNISAASLLLPIPHCVALPTSNAQLSSTAVQAAAVRTTVYPCPAPDEFTSAAAAVRVTVAARTTAAARTAAAPRRTVRSSSSGVTASSAFTKAATSDRVLRSSTKSSDTSNRCTDTSASTSGRTLRSTAGRFDLSCTSTSTTADASELPTFNCSSSRDGCSGTPSSSARRRKHTDLESSANYHPPHSGKRPRLVLTVTEAAPAPSKGVDHSRKRYRNSHVQVSSRAATCQSDAVILVPTQPTRTMGSRRTEPTLASSRARSQHVHDRRKVDRRERDACSSSSDYDDVARSVSSRHSREHDGSRGSRRAALRRRLRSPSPLPRDGGSDRLRSATRCSSGRASQRKGTALGSHDAATHVKDRSRASGDWRSSGDIPPAADSDAVPGSLRSDGAAAESCTSSSIDSGVRLLAGQRGPTSSGRTVAASHDHSRPTSSSSSRRNVVRSDGRPVSTNRALDPPDAAVPSASSSRMPPTAAATRASNKKNYVTNDPLRRVPRIRKPSSTRSYETDEATRALRKATSTTIQ